MNIQQIAQSVNETNNYDVLSTLLNCREYEREWEKRHSLIRTPWSDIGKREVMEFAIVQKDPRGFELLHEVRGVVEEQPTTRLTHHSCTHTEI